MENWNEELIKALQLNGKAERSQANYIRTVRILTEHCGKTPDLITEEELQEYFLHRRNVSQWAPNTMKSCYAGCRFFFENVLKRDWHIFKIARAKAEQRMPTVLTIEEVHNILAHESVGEFNQRLDVLGRVEFSASLWFYFAFSAILWFHGWQDYGHINNL